MPSEATRTPEPRSSPPLISVLMRQTAGLPCCWAACLPGPGSYSLFVSPPLDRDEPLATLHWPCSGAARSKRRIIESSRFIIPLFSVVCSDCPCVLGPLILSHPHNPDIVPRPSRIPLRSILIAWYQEDKDGSLFAIAPASRDYQRLVYTPFDTGGTCNIRPYTRWRTA